MDFRSVLKPFVMKKILSFFIPLIIAVSGCSTDEISVVESTGSTGGISVDCSSLNADISVLQTLSKELAGGSTVLSVSDNTITFSSGTSVTLAIRDSYSFSYVNPVVATSSSKWIVDGSELSSSFSDDLLKIKAESGSWYAYYSSAWHVLSEILQGDSIPVFAGLDVEDDAVYVRLGSGATMTFEVYAGSESLKLSASSLTLPKEGGSATVTITAGNSSWKATSSESWLSVSPASGEEGSAEVTLSADANEGTVRSARVKFAGGEITTWLTVTQDGESGGGTIASSDTDDSDDNVANTEFDRTITITYSSSGASVTGDANGIVTVSGNDVTADNSSTDEKVIYQLSGSASDGFFKVYSSRKQAIVLDGLTLTNKNGAAINVQGPVSTPSKGKRTYIVVNGVNSIADGSSYTDTPSAEDEKAVLFSEGQLIFSGSGSLSVTAKGKAGITSDDYVRFMSSPTVKVVSSAGHGVRGKDYILVSNGNVNVAVSADMKKGFSSDSLVRFDGGVTTINITGSAAYDSDDKEYSGTAGVKADKKFEMTGGIVTITNSGRGGKGIKVGGSYDTSLSAQKNLEQNAVLDSYISGGELTVKVTGANHTSGDVSSKGIKVGWSYKSGSNSHTYTAFSGNLTVTGGSVHVSSSSNEALEVKGELNVAGGEVYAYSSADDAINSASTMTISGGYVCGYSTANDGIDANGNCYLKGGVVYAIGKNSPELAVDANSEGGFKLYVEGGTIIAIGGLENGASLSQKCYQSSSWSKSTWYALKVGSDTYAFKTPSSGGSPLVVSGASTPTLSSGVTASGGTAYFDGLLREGCSVSGGSSVSLSSYSGGGGQGGPGGGGHR